MLVLSAFIYYKTNKQLLDEVFVIPRIIKIEVSVISQSRRMRLITLTETLIIADITITETNNRFIYRKPHYVEEANQLINLPYFYFAV